MKLSNSSIDLFLLCPFKWKQHYIDKIRSTNISSPLFFGSAVDAACSILLLSKKKNLTEEEKILVTKNPFDVFKEKMEIVEINGEKVNISASTRASYFSKDWDNEFIFHEDLKKINELSSNPFELQYDQLQDFKEECQKTLKAGQELPTDLTILYNYISWTSLVNKGIYLIQCYIDYILPRIKEVISLQEEVRLTGEEEDYISGFIDLTCIWEDDILYVLDNKTSSAKYPQSKLDESQQLSIYSEYKQNRFVGYIVMQKKKMKKPEDQIQILMGKLSEETVDKTFDRIGDVAYQISEGNFEKNMKNCNMYFTKCCYYDRCHGDENSMKGLVKLVDKEEKK